MSENKQSIQLVDTHCHLHLMDLTEFDQEVSLVVKAAKENGIAHMLCVGTRIEDTPKLLEFAKQFPEVSASVGLHPNETVPEGSEEPTVETLVNWAKQDAIVAIGETGLDYYRTEEKQPWQQDRFRTHIRAAIEVNKPLIIHTRQAVEDTLKILREEEASKVGGIFHCFTEDWAMAEAGLELNFYISFSGIVTFKNAVQLQEVAKKVPLDRLLIETDAPYLAPMPHRGKMNQPAYVRYVAEYLATLKNVSLETLAKQTTDNFYRLIKKN